MKLALILLALAAGLALLFAAWVRLAPADATALHADPQDAPAGGRGGWVVRPEGGDATAPVWAVPPEAALAAFAAVADAAPRTVRLAGSETTGRITWTQRSRVWGFPDDISVTALPVDGGGSTLAIWSRQRIGQYDWGVNRDRVERWLGALDLPPRE